MADFTGKKIAVLGFGAEGRSATQFMLRHGALVEIFEAKAETQFAPEDVEVAENLQKDGAIFHFGSSVLVGNFDLVLRSPGIPPKNRHLTDAAARNIPISSSTAVFFDSFPGTAVGITGTKGKGTTASLIYEMLKFAGRKTELLGNIGVPPLDALDRLDAETIVVFELSSFQLMEIKKSPHIAVVLMITRDHLDFHGSVAEYEAAKQNIVEYQKPEDFTIANTDYIGTERIAAASHAQKLWVSREHFVKEGAFMENGEIILIRGGMREEIINIEDIALPGPHNLENVCAAVAAASALGLSKDAMQYALRNFSGLPHRLTLVGEKNGVRYYDDSISTTPESAIAAIRAFTNPKVLVLGGSSKGADFSELGDIIKSDASVRAVIGIGEEWPKIKKELDGAATEIIEGARNMAEVVKAASGVAKSGDVVILSPACASFDMFKNYKDRGDQFAAAVKALE